MNRTPTSLQSKPEAHDSGSALLPTGCTEYVVPPESLSAMCQAATHPSFSAFLKEKQASFGVVLNAVGGVDIRAHGDGYPSNITINNTGNIVSMLEGGRKPKIVTEPIAIDPDFFEQVACMCQSFIFETSPGIVA